MYPEVPQLNVGPTSLNDFSDAETAYEKTVRVIHDMSSASVYKYTETILTGTTSATSGSVLVDNPASKRNCST